MKEMLIRRVGTILLLCTIVCESYNPTAVADSVCQKISSLNCNWSGFPMGDECCLDHGDSADKAYCMPMNNGGCDCCCLGENDKALKKNGEVSLLKDVVIGDYIFDGDSFTKVLTVEYGRQQNMMKMFLTNIQNISDETTVTLTGNHLLYDLNDELMTAKDVKIGDIIFNNYLVNKIENDLQHSSTPVTYSGYLQVNGGVKVSSYPRSKKFASLVHNYLSTFRWFSDNISEQITGKLLEWISTDHHFWYRLMGDAFWENSFNFHAFTPLVIAIILVQRLWFLPIIMFVLLQVWCINARIFEKSKCDVTKCYESTKSTKSTISTTTK